MLQDSSPFHSGWQPAGSFSPQSMLSIRSVFPQPRAKQDNVSGQNSDLDYKFFSSYCWSASLNLKCVLAADLMHIYIYIYIYIFIHEYLNHTVTFTPQEKYAAVLSSESHKAKKIERVIRLTGSH